MDALLLVSRVVLALVLVVAAVAKMVNRPGTKESLERFGVRASVAPAASVALPVVELGIAVALVPVQTAWAAALAALVLLTAFTVAIGVAIVRGDDAPCNCFGTISARPIGPKVLARNLVLIGLAFFVVAAGRSGDSAVAWTADLSTGAALGLAGGVLLAIALAINGAFLWQLFRQNGRLWIEIEALRTELDERGQAKRPSQMGQPAPRFELPDLSGRLVSLDDLLEGGRALWLVFSDPGCGACDSVLPEIARLQSDPLADPWPVLLTLGSAEENRAKVSDHGVQLVLLHEDFELPGSLGLGGVPGLVLLDPAGQIMSEPVVGAAAVLDVLRAQSLFDPSQILEAESAS